MDDLFTLNEIELKDAYKNAVVEDDVMGETVFVADEEQRDLIFEELVRRFGEQYYEEFPDMEEEGQATDFFSGVQAFLERD